jgi:hypothetical protein
MRSETGVKLGLQFFTEIKNPTAAEMSARKTPPRSRNCIGSALLSKTSLSLLGYCFGPGVRYQRFYLFAPCDADCVNEKGSPAGADKQQINRCLAVREPKP